MKNIYCKHMWEIGQCGTYSDCWRWCERCQTKWWPLREQLVKPSKSWLLNFIFGRGSYGIYGKEPKIVTGVCK